MVAQNPEPMGMYITSIFGLIAVGIVAVWSLLSNLLAGFLWLLSKHFRIGQKITILPENINGTIREIVPMFFVLDSSHSYVYLPNSMLFQKIIRRNKS